MLLGKAAEIDQDLLHLFGQHLLEVLVPPHELNNDIVPLLDSREVVSVLQFQDYPQINIRIGQIVIRT